MRYHADSLDPFDLLAELGRDCVGAIQLLDIGEQPADIFSIRQRPLAEAQIAEMLRNTATTLPGLQGQDDDLRLSIAGAQEKRRCCGMTTSGVYLREIRRPRIFSN